MSINSYTIVIQDYRTIWIEHVPRDEVLINILINEYKILLSIKASSYSILNY